MHVVMAVEIAVAVEYVWCRCWRPVLVVVVLIIVVVVGARAVVALIMLHRRLRCGRQCRRIVTTVAAANLSANANT